MSKKQNFEFQISVWDYINRLKRKELWATCNQFPNFREDYPDNYRDITNEDLIEFLKNEYYNGDLTEYLNN